MKRIIVISLLLAVFGLAKASINQVEVPVVMTEKVVNPNGSQTEPHRSPDSTLVIFQSGNTFYFGESLIGCAVTLLFNDVEVYSDIVGSEGTVTIPEDFTGSFELCLNVGSQVFSAEIEL